MEIPYRATSALRPSRRGNFCIHLTFYFNFFLQIQRLSFTAHVGDLVSYCWKSRVQAHTQCRRALLPGCSPLACQSSRNSRVKTDLRLKVAF